MWKDRFFFDALETSEDDLCYECKEEMRLAFYVQGGSEPGLEVETARELVQSERM